MKFAVISDIHGNLPALNAVIEDAEKKNIDQFIFAGDYCLSNPYPDECVSRIRELDNKCVIRGNEEKYLENLIGKDQSAWTDGQMQISYWCYRSISPENIAYLMALPARLDFTCNGVDLHIAHSSEEFIADCEHREWCTTKVARRYPDGFISRETFREDIHRYLNSDKQFQDIFAKLEERRVPFAKEEYIENLRASGQYKEANVWSRVIQKELRTAREHIGFFLDYVEKYARETGDARRPFTVSTWEKAFELWEGETDTERA